MWTHYWLVELRVETGHLRSEVVTHTGALAEVLPVYKAAASDPRVLQRKLHRIRRLDESTRPRRCECGRFYQAAQAPLHARMDWWQCRGCLGHWVITCQACARRRVWPEPAEDCRATRQG